MQLRRLKDLCIDIVSGGTPSTKEPALWREDIPWITSADITESFDIEPKRFISKEGKNKVLPANNILIVTRVGLGKIASNKYPIAFSQDIQGLIIKTGLHIPYLLHALSIQVKKFKDIGRGATIKGVTRDDLERIEIPLPDLQTQKQIAQVLEDADRARQQRKAANALTDQFLQSSFLHLFGDPVRNEKGWELKRLEELGKWQSGGTPLRQVQDFFNGNIPWYTSGELNQMFVSKSSEYITEEAIRNSNAKLVEPNSLLLGMYDTAALKSSITKIKSACNQAIAYSKLEFGNANIFYVYHAIQYGKEHFRSQQRGVRQKNLNLTMIKELQLPIPPLSLQQHFASLVADAEILRQKQQQSEKELEHLFGALLQQYFGSQSTSYLLPMDASLSLAAEAEQHYSA